jgi:hypothetical protein
LFSWWISQLEQTCLSVILYWCEAWGEALLKGEKLRKKKKTKTTNSGLIEIKRVFEECLFLHSIHQ